MKIAYKALLITCVTSLAAMTAHAHHSFAMFDRSTEVVKTGTVQRWAFNNPHSWRRYTRSTPTKAPTRTSPEITLSILMNKCVLKDIRG